MSNAQSKKSRLHESSYLFLPWIEFIYLSSDNDDEQKK